MINLQNKRILVLGMGLSGISAARLAKAKGAEVFAVSQGLPADWGSFNELKELLGLDHLFDQNDGTLIDLLDNIDLIVKSPGVPWTIDLLENALKKKIKIWSEIELASQFNTAPIVAVTGTNGKTTTVSMMEDAVKKAGVKAFVGGNIGTPFCELILSEEVVELVILELSSFQLETMQDFHPHVGVVLNLFHNHGERYKSIEEYGEAKFHLADNMKSSDVFLFDQEISMAAQWLKNSDVTAVPLDLKDIQKLLMELEAVFDLSEFKLAGNHNIINLYFAWRALDEMGDFQAGLQEMINTFAGVSHRLEYAGMSGEREFYNDAKSTNWDASLIALKAMEGKRHPLSLIVGGKLRGENDLPEDSVIKEINEQASFLFFMGESGKFLKDKIKLEIPVFYFETLREILMYIKENQAEGTILFSPAFPSFDQYKNYVERGESFKKLLKEIL